MTNYQVQIPLAASSVSEAWRRYVGFEGTQIAEPELAWQSSDGSGLSAQFIAEGNDATLLSASRPDDSDAVPEAVADVPPQSLAEFVDGFVAYLNAAYEGVAPSAGADHGDAPVGPDGAAHMAEQPPGLGSDNEPSA